MRNMNDLVRQAGVMQNKIAKMQQEMAERTVEASSGGGMVKVVATCKQDIVSITIDPKALEGGDVEIVGAFPAGIIGATEANLLASAAGENHEHTEMYPSFAAVAEKEGFSEIAAVMRSIAVAEAYHEKRFLALAKDIKEGRMFMREKATVWRCRNCGCLVEGTHAPEMCPACAHPKDHFEELNYTF